MTIVGPPTNRFADGGCARTTDVPPDAALVGRWTKLESVTHTTTKTSPPRTYVPGKEREARRTIPKRTNEPMAKTHPFDPNEPEGADDNTEPAVGPEPAATTGAGVFVGVAVVPAGNAEAVPGAPSCTLMGSPSGSARSTAEGPKRLVVPAPAAWNVSVARTPLPDGPTALVPDVAQAKRTVSASTVGG